MCVPALDALASRFSLTLVGKAWAGSLFEAYGWPVVPLAGSWWHQRDAIRAQPAADGASALLFTHSLGTALQLRLAGLRPRGYATAGRRLLLERVVLGARRRARNGA